MPRLSPIVPACLNRFQDPAHAGVISQTFACLDLLKPAHVGVICYDTGLFKTLGALPSWSYLHDSGLSKAFESLPIPELFP